MALPQKEDQGQLLAHLISSPELGQLETMLRRFNLFEALGLVRRELRHSDFLAFLLDPQQTHELGDAFIRLFIQTVTAKTQGIVLSGDNLQGDAEYRAIEIRREWKNIDILLLDHTQERLFIIENKIDTGEHSNQLVRYRHLADQTYPNWEIFGVFLTPDATQPSFNEFVALGYQQIRNIIQGLLNDPSLSISIDVRMLLTHYVQMLGRHIVSDSDIAKLCRQLYRQHKQALDLIFEYRDDRRQKILRDAATKLVRETPSLLLDWNYKWNDYHSCDFIVRGWDKSRLRQSSNGKNKSLLLFSLKSRPTSFDLDLLITPGTDEVRQELFAMAKSNQPPFEVSNDQLHEWHWIYGREFLTEDIYEDGSDSELIAEIRRQWGEFTSQDLPKITTVVGKMLTR